MTVTTRRTQPISNRRIALVAMLASGLAVGLAAPPPAPAAKRPQRLSALPAFGSCQSLLSFARRNARRTNGQTGVPTRAGAFTPQVLDAPPPMPPAVAGDTLVRPTAPAAAPMATTGGEGRGGDGGGPTFSGTNVQEAGVDEPDIIKTDGKRIFAIANGRIHALRVTGDDEPKLVGTLELQGAAHQLLLRGDRLLAMSTSYSYAGDAVYSTSQVILTEVDVTDPAAMAIRRTMNLDGALVDARLTGGTARVVVGASPDYIRPAAIGSAPVRRWVPATTLRSRVSGRTFRRSVVDCDDVRHPRAFSGLDLLTVLTIDLDKGLFDVDRDAVMAGAQTVYASTTGLYVASQKYVPALEDGRTVPARSRTQIHRFDASKNGETTYVSSGEVRGFVLNQYSLSEFDGALRVASTEEPQWFPDGSVQGESESFVTVLAERGNVLRALGRVDGLGKGERIYAVRFVGDKGYVVTFRQTDPLYTLDLSSKTEPKVLGELKILGYSAYLHPISDDLLLGVGQDATEQGQRLGAQLSLFDVSDLRRPVRKANVTLGGSSTAEFDPHAFLYWDPTKLAVIPLERYGSDADRFNGAIGFTIGASSIAEAGRIVHPGGQTYSGTTYPPEIGRSLVIGDKLFTLSYEGLAMHRVGTLSPLTFTAFPKPPAPEPVPIPGPPTPPVPLPLPPG